jgi:hypothetical protein
METKFARASLMLGQGCRGFFHISSRRKKNPTLLLPWLSASTPKKILGWVFVKKV